jgi:hypothetical protein
MKQTTYTLVSGITTGTQTAVDAIIVYLGATSVITASKATIIVSCIGIAITAFLTICSKFVSSSDSSSST